MSNSALNVSVFNDIYDQIMWNFINYIVQITNRVHLILPKINKYIKFSGGLESNRYCVAHNHGELKVHFPQRVYVCVTWEYHKKLSEPTETHKKKNY